MQFPVEWGSGVWWPNGAAHDCVEYSGVLDLGVVTWHVVLYASSDDRDWPWPFCDLPQTSQFPFHKWPPPLASVQSMHHHANHHNPSDKNTACSCWSMKIKLEWNWRFKSMESTNYLVKLNNFLKFQFSCWITAFVIF